ncbi:amino acid ABC transporter substrate-binding protein [Psychromarinibacter sp. C21-152]|uniref:Amino acid ABC transporter substrate-binding protein n=1 Tax=Psychromarinibacter sediminicola TaxID=3033385 RepID=A0AAE3NV52_9RHOB|nr:amino acid ABC transporter substrate-binding protein [Psychromarinibacter sediminicola]MDF0602856.1 amino acid ABC transporter substrate-binding protein [Psychromarinibacter sediminicola]
MKRRTLLNTTVALTLSAALAGPALAQETLKIGAVGPKTGPLAGGAAVTHWPNIELWSTEVNERGGIDVDGTKYMVEIIEYDDQTNPSETISAVTRLATQDEADFILAPYSTGLNLAAAPIFDRFGYPQVTSTASTDRVGELSDQFPNLFFLLGQNSEIVGDAVEILTELREAGDIGNRVAMVNVADAFGIELAASAKPIFEEAGFELVYETSYPLGTPDLSPVMKSAKDSEPDAFVAWSYPPDTFGLTEQAVIEELDVGVFYTAVATAFPAYKQRFGAAAEGVMGIGGVNAESESFQDYAARHMEVTGQAPDYWASGMMYASLQILEQAITGAGTIDRDTVTQYIKDNSFDTVMGTIEFDENNNNPAYWTVGQWQGDAFRGVASTGREGAVDPILKDGWE